MEITLTGITTTGARISVTMSAILPAIEASRRRDVNRSTSWPTITPCQMSTRRSILKSPPPAGAGTDVENVIFYAQTDVPKSWSDLDPHLRHRPGLMNALTPTRRRWPTTWLIPTRTPTRDQHGVVLLSDPDGGRHSDVQGQQDTGGQGPDPASEMARDIAARFKSTCMGSISSRPKRWWTKGGGSGRADGRKMSKSYGNTIPLFEPESAQADHADQDQLAAAGSAERPRHLHVVPFTNFGYGGGSSGDTHHCYAQRIGWGEMKQFLFEYLNARLRANAPTLPGVVASPRPHRADSNAGGSGRREYSAVLAEPWRASGILPLDQR